MLDRKEVVISRGVLDERLHVVARNSNEAGHRKGKRGVELGQVRGMDGARERIKVKEGKSGQHLKLR